MAGTYAAHAVIPSAGVAGAMAKGLAMSGAPGRDVPAAAAVGSVASRALARMLAQRAAGLR